MDKKPKKLDKLEIREISGKISHVADRLKNSGDLTHYKKALALVKTLQKTSRLDKARTLEQEFISVLKKKYPTYAIKFPGDMGGYDDPGYTPPPQAVDAVDILDHNAANNYHGAIGKCATYVIEAINQASRLGDGRITVEPIGNYDSRKGFACHLGDALTDPKANFKVAYDSTKSISPYQPVKGDVAVIQPYPGGPPYGHACMWDGQEWVSDYKQNKGDISPYPWTPGTYNPKQTPYKIYHWPGRGG